MQSTVAVVGAGLAGLAAARRLAADGLTVSVFDKARRPGGRVCTRRAEAGAFDHGAQYFTARDAGFAALVAEWCQRGVARRWEGPVVRLAAGAHEPAPGGAPRYVGVPGMSALARALAEGLAIACERRIERVERAPRGWRLVDAAGRAAEAFDAVVVATPAPQAVPLLAASPGLARSAASVAMQPCLAAMVAFAEPLPVDFAGAFVADSPLAWIARDGSKPGRNGGECWVLHASPAWSAAWLEEPSEAVVTALLDALGAALGAALPETVHRAAHRWRFARASRPLGETPWDPTLRLGACGDWTLGDRLESAFASGERLACAILASSRADA